MINVPTYSAHKFTGSYVARFTACRVCGISEDILWLVPSAFSPFTQCFLLHMSRDQRPSLTGQTSTRWVTLMLCSYTPHTVHTSHCTCPTLYMPHTVHIPHVHTPLAHTPHYIHPTLYAPHNVDAPQSTHALSFPVSTQCWESVVECAPLLTMAILITRPQAGTKCRKLHRHLTYIL